MLFDEKPAKPAAWKLWAFDALELTVQFAFVATAAFVGFMIWKHYDGKSSSAPEPVPRLEMKAESRPVPPIPPRTAPIPSESPQQFLSHSREDCLRAAGGVVNETYARCRNGY